MGLLSIDREKCTRDGLCALACPARIIHLPEEGPPEMVPGGEAICIVCGHCVAVCPHGALSHAGVPMEDSPPVQTELVISREQAVRFLRSRRSIRVYKDRPVERETLQRLIEIARYAPSGGNNQKVEWLACNDQGKVRRFAGMTADWIRDVLAYDPEGAPFPAEFLRYFLALWDAGHDAILRGAPALVVAMSPQEVGNGMVDPTIALAYFELAAPTFGLGACWAGLLARGLDHWPPLREAMGLPDGYPFHYPMMVGYPGVKYHRLPERRQPIIKWL